jgi:hypothetical protein
MPILKGLFKTALWLLGVFVIFMLYCIVVLPVVGFPDWADKPSIWLYEALGSPPESAEDVAITFVATVHLAVIAVVVILSYAGVKLWEKKAVGQKISRVVEALGTRHKWVLVGTTAITSMGRTVKPVLKRLFKIVLWLFCAFAVIRLYYGLVLLFLDYPEWASKPSLWLHKTLGLPPNRVDMVITTFAATVHLAVIAIVALPFYVGFRRWKKKRSGKVTQTRADNMPILERLFRIALWLLAGLVAFYLYLGAIVWY